MEAIRALEQSHRKPALPQVMSGDTVRVHQLIREGAKQRIQVFEGVIIRRHRLGELTATITVRRIASGIGVEKTFLLHSPNVSKVEILRRAKVRRNFLSFLRERRGKSARLREIAFDKVAANDVTVIVSESTIVTEIDAAQEDDVLNDSVSLDQEIKAEDKAVRDEATAGDEPADDESQMEETEAEQGLDKVEAREDKAL